MATTHEHLSDDIKDRIIGLERIDPASLTAHPQNFRRHPTAQRRALRASLERFGWSAAVLVTRDGTVVDGHARVEEALSAGSATVPVLRLDMSEEEAGSLILRLDPIAAMAETDEDVLSDLLADEPFVEDEADLLASLLGETADDVGVPDGADDVPENVAAVSKRGDVWLLRSEHGMVHRVICGDCRDGDDVARVMDGAAINMAFTSPPYAEQREYDPSSGFKPIPPDEYVSWFEAVQANVRSVLADDGSWFVNIKPSTTPDGLDTETYVLDLVLAHRREWGWHWVTEFCWERVGVPKSVSRRFKNQFEPVYQFAMGPWKMRPNQVMHESAHAIRPTGPGVGNTSWADPHSNTISQGQKGDMFDSRRQGGLAYPGNRLPTFAGSHEAFGHGAAFPVGLPQWFTKAYTDQGDHVYDPFLGSGSTLIACELEHRTCHGIELSPAYVDIICARWQGLTGIMPEHADTGEIHDFIGNTP